eukprot:jgi/Mesvir1/27173/Mv20833-RA.1
MAANFWLSTHKRQLIDSSKITVHEKDAAHGFTLDDIKKLKVHHSNYIRELAVATKARQRVVATAITYFRRFYLRHAFVDYDPRLVAPACLYLAAKSEESVLQAILLCHQIQKKLYPMDTSYHFKVDQLLEMERHLLEGLNFDLVLFHPYRPLILFLSDAGLKDLTQEAWSLVNDMFRTDLVLCYPPYLLAVAAVLMVATLRGRDVAPWVEEVRVEVEEIQAITLEMLAFYESYAVVTEAEVNAMHRKIGCRTVPVMATTTGRPPETS